MTFDLFGYDENACKKRSISPHGKSDENHFPQQNELTMVRCPPIDDRITFMLPMRMYLDLYYIASNGRNHSVTLFIRKNKKGKLPTQNTNVNNLPMDSMTKDIRRWRFLPSRLKMHETSHHEKSYQEIKDELINSETEDVRMPSTLARVNRENFKEMFQAGGLLQTSLNKWLADDSVIAFSKVKIIKSSKYINLIKSKLMLVD